MNAETLLQAIDKLDEAERRRFFALLEDHYKSKPMDQAEAGRLLGMMDDPKTVWHTHDEVERMLKQAAGS